MIRLNISQQPIKLDYTIQNAKLSLQSTPPQLEIRTTPAQLDIRQPRGELTIDSTPCRDSIGLRNNEGFARDNAQLGKRTVLETIARISQEGDRMAHIERKENAIAEIAADSNISSARDLVWAHIDSPSINYQTNPPIVNYTAGTLNYTFQRGTFHGDYQPGSVDIRVVQYPSLQISTVDVKV